MKMNSEFYVNYYFRNKNNLTVILDVNAKKLENGTDKKYGRSFSKKIFTVFKFLFGSEKQEVFLCF